MDASPSSSSARGRARSASVSPRGSRVVARSSPTSNPSCRSCERTQTTPPASGRLARDSAVECEALAWAEEAEIPTPNAFVGDGDGDARSRGWDLVAGCEILYWGGWDIFDEDTRAPLLATMRRACALGRIPGDGDKDGDDSAELALAFTVRDKGRETGFVLDGVGEHFWLRVIPGERDGDGDGDGVLNRARLDAEARAAVAAAREGDLLLLGGRLKDPNP